MIVLDKLLDRTENKFLRVIYTAITFFSIVAIITLILGLIFKWSV